ncbi:fumarylacetoacetate hydrolase family protein [Sphingomonas mali]|uniref:fumarylacetoacetate hydrolase family protein n=1 Tax=Sphingomonas mali TaxID=40682 RepID=UPI000829AFD8|nr:fumarylacetoacetate hydrolase family protein [Sphingomonas mali]
MRFATLDNATRDGCLVVLSRDLLRCSPVAGVSTLQQLLDDWDANLPACVAAATVLEDGSGDAFDWRSTLAPLPRAWQWLDGSAYPSHGKLMDQVLGVAPESTGRPLMYQGLSNQFLAPHADVPLPDEAHGIDFEGEFGVIVGDVPMGADAPTAAAAIRLLVQINDWSLRALAGPEMKTGFGWVQAKPACSMAPIAATPDELGEEWRDGRIHLLLSTDRGGERFGRVSGGPMAWNFIDLIVHAARTRQLCAGTVIGSGTVSNENFREVGSSCIAERRGIEIVDRGVAETPFLRFGERVRMEALDNQGRSVFGAIDQQVVAAAG